MSRTFVLVGLILCAGFSQWPNEKQVEVAGLIYSMATDGYDYQPGDSVRMRYRIINPREDTVIFRFRSLPYADFAVNSGAVWRSTYATLPLCWDLKLSPEDSTEAFAVWDMHDSEGNLVAPGVYECSGVYRYDEPEPYPLAVEIRVLDSVPEPRTSGADSGIALHISKSLSTGSWVVQCRVKREQRLELTVYSSTGIPVIRLWQGRMTPGNYQFELNTASMNRLPAGVYYLRLGAEGFTTGQRLVLIR
ncbi:MAG: hypothetical protein N2248_02220 [candidate division WOR-3 bacterium]|uniref:T9SS type A sorting domain-containing protein n=1 Tax=candidate division WOR-3 bacterium TaxID=2052148 RepID=A0A7C3IZ80_UNCW3|nr:hypothetical protein [candidate division WOR-3 bacterium]